MIHHFEKGNSMLVVLFHGTGGDEFDLIPLSRSLFPDASILSLRGNISENGMNRFFRRISFNVFDEKNVLEEAQKIHDFLVQKIKELRNNFSISTTIFLGYSNGANMIGVLLQKYPELTQKAILLHPMQIINESEKINARIILTSGKKDSMIPFTETKKLEYFLQSKGATLTHHQFQGGHEISPEEIKTIKNNISFLK